MKVVSRVIHRSVKSSVSKEKQNTKLLAVCSAQLGAGRVLDPVIVFSGKNLQSTWRGDRALPATYGISENGWMTTEVFAEWFTQFTALITEELMEELAWSINTPQKTVYHQRKMRTMLQPLIPCQWHPRHR